MKTKKLIFILLFTAFTPFSVVDRIHATGEGPSQPEALQFEPVEATDLVNLATGDFVYTLPLLVVPGPAGDYPINLSYHSGIGPNQDATWVGLGWSLNPGAVNRTISGYPDDYKGDYVQTHYEAKPLGGFGIGIGGGYGPAGGNITYDSYTGQLGANYFVSLDLFSFGGGESSAGGIGLTLSAGTSGASASLGAHYGPANVGVSAGTQGVGLSGSIGAYGNDAVGFSLSTGSGASYSIAGTTIRSMSESSGGKLSSSTGTIVIPIYGAWISLSYSEWSWTLNETFDERSYGYLHQDPYYRDFGSTVVKKYERQKQGDFLYPSQDVYSVQAQGIGGVFMPFQRNAYILWDNKDHREKAQLASIDYRLDNRPKSDLIFRFLGEAGANFVTNDGRDITGSGWGGDYQNLFDRRFGSRDIQPNLDLQSGKILGFTITDADGKIYEFMQPVRNLFLYSWTKDNKQKTESYTSMATPYASNWLLTAIKGPDYVDYNRDGKCSDGDWGYWVKFEHGMADRPQVWRSPYRDTAPGAFSTDVETMSIGAREMVYLDRIETATHLALFRKSPAKDRYTAVADRAHTLFGFGEYVIPHYKFIFNGDWTKLLDNAPDNEILVEAKISFGVPLPGSGGGPAFPRAYTKQDFVSWEYNGKVTVIKVPETPRNEPVHHFSDVYLHLDKLMQNSYNVAQKLDRIDLYAKSDAGVEPDKKGNWIVDEKKAVIIKSAKFTYDYSLCPQTPSSQATTDDGAFGGKTTLRAVQFLGKGGQAGMPPYRFIYAQNDEPATGRNPRYYANNWDKWGDYRYPIVDGFIYTPAGDKYEHHTLQEKNYADLTAAWSLTHVVTPTNGVIRVEYESDDYYHVNHYVDLNEMEEIVAASPLPPQPMTLRAVGPVEPSANGNTIRIPLQTAQFDPPLREGKFLSIFEVYDANATAYWREVWVYNRKITSLTTSGQFMTVTYEGEPIDFKTYSPDYFKYYVRPFQRKVYGGGIRVKSVASIENGKSYKTKYVYADEDGFSTGVTPTLPAPYGEFANDSTKAYRKPNSDWYKIHHEDWRNYRALFTDHAKSYGRPAPGVVYSRVEVMNVDEKDQPLNGKTVYEFYTAKDDPYLPEDDGTTLVMNNKSSLYGTPKAITYYEQIGKAPAFRKVKQNQFHYALSEDMVGPERISSKQPIKNLDKKPLGLLQEKYRFHNEFEHPIIEDYTKAVARQVDNRHQSAYNLYASSTMYDYSSAAATAPSHSMTTGKLNFKWEALSGQVVENGRASSDRQLYLTAVTPAYWKYDGMEKKNMLTQTTQETTYLTALPPSFQFDPDLFPVRLGMMQSTQSSQASEPASQPKETKPSTTRATPAKSPKAIIPQIEIAKIASQFAPVIKLPIFTTNLFPQREVLFSKITTWSGSWHAGELAGFYEREQPWRQDDAFAYNKQRDLEDGVSHFANFDPWTNTNIDKDYPPVTPASPWKMTDNTTLYDVNSHFVEQKRLDGTRTTRLYGYSRAMPIGMATNATREETQYFNFEEGTSSLITSDERKTGEKSMKAVELPLSNIADTIKFSLNENVVYRVSFWAKKGTAALSSQLNLYFSGQGLQNQTRVGGVLQTADRWEYFAGTITPTQAGQISMTVSAGIIGSGQYHFIDDIRIHPIDAQMETYAHDPLLLKVSAITNKNNITTHYEYDTMGRLIHIRDQDRNLRKRYVYNYGTSKQPIFFPPPQLIATGKAGGN